MPLLEMWKLIFGIVIVTFCSSRNAYGQNKNIPANLKPILEISGVRASHYDKHGKKYYILIANKEHEKHSILRINDKLKVDTVCHVICNSEAFTSFNTICSNSGNILTFISRASELTSKTAEKIDSISNIENLKSLGLLINWNKNGNIVWHKHLYDVDSSFSLFDFGFFRLSKYHKESFLFKVTSKDGHRTDSLRLGSDWIPLPNELPKRHSVARRHFVGELNPNGSINQIFDFNTTYLNRKFDSNEHGFYALSSKANLLDISLENHSITNLTPELRIIDFTALKSDLSYVTKDKVKPKLFFVRNGEVFWEKEFESKKSNSDYQNRWSKLTEDKKHIHYYSIQSLRCKKKINHANFWHECDMIIRRHVISKKNGKTVSMHKFMIDASILEGAYEFVGGTKDRFGFRFSDKFMVYQPTLENEN